MDIVFSIPLDDASVNAIEVLSQLSNINLTHDIQVVNSNTLQIALSGLQSTDTLTLSLDPSLIVAEEGSGLYTMDVVDSEDITWKFNVEYLGDYNHSGHIDGEPILDSDDIDTLIQYWGENNLYEL